MKTLEDIERKESLWLLILVIKSFLKVSGMLTIGMARSIITKAGTPARVFSLLNEKCDFILSSY